MISSGNGWLTPHLLPKFPKPLSSSPSFPVLSIFDEKIKNKIEQKYQKAESEEGD